MLPIILIPKSFSANQNCDGLKVAHIAIQSPFARAVFSEKGVPPEALQAYHVIETVLYGYSAWQCNPKLTHNPIRLLSAIGLGILSVLTNPIIASYWTQNTGILCLGNIFSKLSIWKAGSVLSDDCAQKLDEEKNRKKFFTTLMAYALINNFEHFFSSKCENKFMISSLCLFLRSVTSGIFGWPGEPKGKHDFIEKLVDAAFQGIGSILTVPFVTMYLLSKIKPELKNFLNSEVVTDNDFMLLPCVSYVCCIGALSNLKSVLKK